MKKGLLIGVCFLFILIVLISFASAGWFSDLFKAKITGEVTYSDCILNNPKDLAGNGILVSEHYFGVGNYENYAGKYCEIVWGCTGFKDVTIADDSVKACRCDTNSFGCNGDSCIDDVSTTTYWERVASVTCTGCPTDCSGGASPVCGDGTIDAGEECDDGNSVSGDGCSSSCTNEAAPFQTCTDSDVDAIQYPHGKNYYEKGFYSGYGDFCSLNVGEENILLEYYCSYDASGDPVKNYTQYNCSTEGMVCVLGVCMGEELGFDMDACLDGLENYWDQETDSCKSGYINDTSFFKEICSDPDDGQNIFEYAHTFGFRSYSSADDSSRDLRIRTGGADACLPDLKIREYYCDADGYIRSVSMDCPDGCENGTCVGEPIDECTDSDGDLSLDEQYYVQGTTSLKNSSSEDVCDGEEIVQEFYCSEDGINNEYYKCPNGCDGGACIEIPIGGECTMGCYLDEKCYNIGVRKSGDYCGEDLDFEKQKEPDAICGDNFECLSNICIDGACIQASLWKRFLALIRGEISWSDIFGTGDDKNLVADDLVLTFETGDEYALILLDYGEENLDETDEYFTGFFLDFEGGYGFEYNKGISRDFLSLNGVDLVFSELESDLTSFKVRAIMDTKEEIKESDKEDNCIQQSFTIVRDDNGNVTGFESGEVESCVEEEQPPITGECTDNDSGFDPYIYGVMKREGVAFDYVDMCYPANSTHLHEWVCDSSVSDPLIVAIHEYYPDGGYWAEVDCPNGCVDGVCISEEPTATCTDDDGGVDGGQYYVKGIANDEVNSFEDGCISAPNYQVDNEGNIDPGEYQAVVDCTGLDCFLFEGICKDLGIAGATYYNCRYGCKEGACVIERPINDVFIAVE